MADSPVSTLFHALQKVYTPILLKDAKWSAEFDPKLQGLITELEQVDKVLINDNFATPWAGALLSP